RNPSASPFDKVLRGRVQPIEIIFNHFRNRQLLTYPCKRHQRKPLLVKHLDLVEITRVTGMAYQKTVNPTQHQRLDILFFNLWRLVGLCDDGAVSHPSDRMLYTTHNGSEKRL